MNRDLRVIVHTYSDFWNISTESFDADPNRYIHCVRTNETRIPDPLLSAAYKLPAPIIPVGSEAWR